MRVTQNLLLQSRASEISAAYARLFVIQQQLSSGSKLLRPSDDPASIRPALDVRAGRSFLAQIKRNADLASGELSTADGVLQSISDVYARAQELATEGANGTGSQADRNSEADEVDGLINQLVGLANSRGASGYLFAGSKRETTPFEMVDTRDGTVVRYHGDDQTTAVDLGNGLQIGLNVPGSEIFGIGTRGATVYSGSTGAAAGTGNDSLRGSDHLTVAHTQTILGDGALGGSGDSASGLNVGASSASGDTVLGGIGAHTINLVDTSGTGASGTISLDGGPAVNWSSSDQDLAVTATNGDVVHLDLSSITAGFSGNVTVQGQGTLSLDGGLTTQAIDFSQQNQLLTDSETGGTIFVDARNIQRTGSNLLRAPGSYDLFSSLIELRDALRNGDNLSTDDQLARIRDTIPEMQRGEDQVLGALSKVGARSRIASTTTAHADALDLTLAQNQSNLEDVDFAQASVDLSRSQLALQASVQVAAQLGQLPSLVTLL